MPCSGNQEIKLPLILQVRFGDLWMNLANFHEGDNNFEEKEN